MTRPSFAGGQTKEVKKQKNNWKRIEGTFEKCWKIVWAPLVRPLISRELRREVFFFFFSFFSNDENGRWQGSVTHPRCSSVYTQYVKADVVYNRGSLSEAQSQSYIAADTASVWRTGRWASLLWAIWTAQHKLGAQHTHGDILSWYRYV